MSSDFSAGSSLPSPTGSSAPSGPPVQNAPPVPNLNNLIRLGDSLYNSSERLNSELFSLTYGALVVQLLKDYHRVELVNQELERMGFSIGERLIEEFLCKTTQMGPQFGVSSLSCNNFRETAYFIAKVAMKMFLGISADCGKFSSNGKSFSLLVKNSPLWEFVEIPAEYQGLKYSNLISGVIKGALQQIQLIVEVDLVEGVTGTPQGGVEEEFKITLKEVRQELFQEEE